MTALSTKTFDIFNFMSVIGGGATQIRGRGIS